MGMLFQLNESPLCKLYISHKKLTIAFLLEFIAKWQFFEKQIL